MYLDDIVLTYREHKPWCLSG